MYKLNFKIYIRFIISILCMYNVYILFTIQNILNKLWSHNKYYTVYILRF